MDIPETVSADISNKGKPAIQKIDGSIVFTKIHDLDIRFFVANKNDLIQSHHFRGEFYEPEELNIISEYFPRGRVFCDIGANIGNHTIYVSKFLHPSQVIVFEPNPAAIAILRANISLNDLENSIDCSNLGVGLSDTAGSASPSIPYNNLGATRMIESDDRNAIALIRGDERLWERRIDFIKMDVESMELRVLEGLRRTIARWRPRMFIEVDEANKENFEWWLLHNDYVTARRFRRYKQNENYMILPVEKCEKED